MPNKMLIDASHPEETRVVVLRGNRVEEFDFESASKKQLRGNIYLAKVTRVEPSLQAAFVEYGGNRHGFLAFSEIHPDYYQIPVADRQALLAAEADEDEEEEEEERRPRRRRRRRGEGQAERRHRADDETVAESVSAGVAADAMNGGSDVAATLGDDPAAVEGDDHPEPPQHESMEAGSASDRVGAGAAPEPIVAVVAESRDARRDAPGRDDDRHDDDAPHDDAHHDDGHEDGHDDAPEETAARDEPHEDVHEEAHEARGSERVEDEDDEDEDDDEEEEEEHVEQVGGDALEEMPRRKPRMRRQYKIQEVIKRRQVLLVQVVKEERGNKGAALTTYLSLAGRYSVLMPNTARGGGISRKITDTGDRKRLKSIVQDLDVPEGMGIILRTAGASRSRPEVKRDFEYLLRMWENVRELTLRSSAPTLVYEEGSLIKRAIRDLYNKDVEEVIVAGDAAWREAKEFMRLIMPSHARNVIPWRDPQAIFVRSGVEAQLDAMFSNQVTLRSGGYLVINQTEALVAIDVNSGRSTREHNIEDTAVRTNLEAADEVARQLRLRDLAGLIVVDFIDMEEGRNNRAVERRLKEALKNDRARIQVGRISHFGLLEMSRQRIRTGVLEGSTAPCPHCAGSGMVRSVASVALHVLRVLEDALTRNAAYDPIVRTRTEVALYILNEKRSHLREIERRFGVHVTVAADESLTGSVYHAMERGGPASGEPEPYTPVPFEPDPEDVVDVAEFELEDEADAPEAPADPEAEPAEAAGDAAEEREAEGEDKNRKRRRRRRGRGRGGDRESAGFQDADAPQPSDDGLSTMASVDPSGYVHPDEASGRPGYWANEATGEPAPFRKTRDAAPDAEAQEPATPAEAETEAGGDAGIAHLPVAAQDADGVAAVVEAPAAVDPPAKAAAPGRPAPDAPTAFDEVPVAAAPAGSVPERGVEAPAQTPEPTRAQEAAAAVRDEPVAAKEAPVAPPPPREPTEVVITEADPSKPKRGGWWSRAKATLGGG